MKKDENQRSLYSSSQVVGTTRASNNITKGEAGSLSKDLKMDIMNTMVTLLDTLQARRQEEAEKALAIYCPTYGMKHLNGECPYNKTKIASILEDKKGATEFKPIYEGMEENEEHV